MAVQERILLHDITCVYHANLYCKSEFVMKKVYKKLQSELQRVLVFFRKIILRHLTIFLTLFCYILITSTS